MDDLLPWSEEMKSWFSAVCVPGTTTFLYRGMIERLRWSDIQKESRRGCGPPDASREFFDSLYLLFSSAAIWAR